MILITYFKLSHISNFSVDAGARTYNVTGTCLLNADTSKADMCVYAYTIAGVSIIATFVVALFLVSLLHREPIPLHYCSASYMPPRQYSWLLISLYSNKWRQQLMAMV